MKPASTKPSSAKPSSAKTSSASSHLLNEGLISRRGYTNWSCCCCETGIDGASQQNAAQCGGHNCNIIHYNSPKCIPGDRIYNSNFSPWSINYIDNRSIQSVVPSSEMLVNGEYSGFQSVCPLRCCRAKPSRIWNRIPDEVRGRIIDMALNEPEMSPRELATRFTDMERYFVSETSVYRLLKAHDLITSPAFIVNKAADAFKDKTTAINQLWQTDFTYLKVIGWGWFYLSTILDDFSRYIIAWKLCTTMKAEDVTDTLQLALTASGCDSARVVHKPRLLSDNGSSYVSADLAEWLDDQGMSHLRGAPHHPANPGQDRALASDLEEPHPA
jgi:hypothetical protein